MPTRSHRAGSLRPLFEKMSANSLSVVCLALGLLLTCSAAPKDGRTSYRIPEYMKLCHRSDPELDKCLKESLQVLIPNFSNGAREFNLPSFDPMILSDMRMEYKNGSVETSIVNKEMKFTGISNINVLDVRSKFKDDGKVAFDIDVFFPEIVSEGTYKMAGKIFDMILSSQGNYKVTMNDIRATWWIRGIPEDRDGETYLRIVHFDMKPKVGSMVIEMDKLFEGSEEMSKMALALINQNWSIIYEELLPLARTNWDKIMTSVANMIFQKVPLDVLLPA
ncbi:hypothetical protein J437_LFUL007992 [Ladona fulva]|uniref:Circadian clock-controlled protein n=1 Tax=Ladona fulva TaxID=123851 RepID=A0A8K0K3M4_LADFU|nr:hypothetical protein J437_LFUL007992 [Ladona fulva]